MKRSSLTLVMFVLVQVVVAGCVLGESVRGSVGNQVSARPVADVLNPGSATRSDGLGSAGRRRAVPPNPQLQFEGTITAASAMSITVHDSHGVDVVLAITSSTIIRHGDQTIAAADLNVGDQVHVKALVQNNVNTAVEILVQRPDDMQEIEIEGTITAASASSITVHDSHGDDVVVAITSSTIIRHGDQAIAAADLNVGDQVHVKAVVQNNVNTATEILVQRPEDMQEIEVNGTITAASSSSITVHDQHGSDVILMLTSSTIIRDEGQTIAATDLKVGEMVEARGVTQNMVTTATQIEVQDDSSGGHH